MIQVGDLVKILIGIKRDKIGLVVDILDDWLGYYTVLFEDETYTIHQERLTKLGEQNE